MSETEFTEAIELLATAHLPNERRVACALIAESSNVLWDRFACSRAHLVMRGGEDTLVQQVLWGSDESPLRTSVESCLSHSTSECPADELLSVRAR